MTRRLLPVATLAAAVLAVPALQGCAADHVASVDVAQAIENTASKQTARITGVVTVEGFGLPGTVRVPLDGVTSLTKPALDLHADLGAALHALKPEVGSLPLDLRVRGSIAYFKVPDAARGLLSSGKQWASLDLRRLVKALGQDPDAVSAMMSVDGSSLLRALRAAGKLHEAGKETIDGTQTTHLHGTVRLLDQLRLLPAKSQAAARAAIAKIAGAHAGEPQPVDVWIDADNVVRRERAVVTLPGRVLLPTGRVTAQIDYADFGTPLATDLPAPKDTFDATSMFANIGFDRAKTPKLP